MGRHGLGRHCCMLGRVTPQGHRGERVLGGHQVRAEPVVSDRAVGIVRPRGCFQRTGAGRKRGAPGSVRGAIVRQAGALSPGEPCRRLDEPCQGRIGNGPCHLGRPRSRHADDCDIEMRL